MLAAIGAYALTLAAEAVSTVEWCHWMRRSDGSEVAAEADGGEE